jgi:Tfp pilus assembly protein PilF
VTRTALTRNPNNLPLQFVEANVHELAGNAAEAEAIYRRLANEDATRVASLNNLANLLATRPERRQEALAFARQAISAAPGSPDVQDTLGWILHLNGESADAIAYLRDAARQAPANAGIVCHYGIVKAKVESAASARGDLERCLELKPEPALARAATGLL